MIIAPLVLSTLVVGIAHMGDTAALGRVGAKALGWFICASLVSLTLGPVMVNLLQPGDGLDLPLPAGDRRRAASTAPRSISSDFVAHIFPDIDHRRDGEQRDPADRRLLVVRRRRDHRGRRAGAGRWSRAIEGLAR